MRWRPLAMGLATILGLGRRGFFIPYRYADRLPRPGAVPRYDALEPLFAAAESEFTRHLEAIDADAAALLAIGGPPPDPRFEQDWFPTLDAAAAYAMVGRHRPRLIVEVGSGHSTRFLARAVADGGLGTRLVAIDPAPRAALEGLPVELVRKPLSAVGPAPFAALEAGDLLIVDSSHILMPGSDVDDLLNRILPLLPAGVLLHLHDIFLPDDYPAAWAWRGYNEQNAIGALIAGGGWRYVFASHYVATRMAARLAQSVVARLPRAPGALDTSLWLEKR